MSITNPRIGLAFEKYSSDKISYSIDLGFGNSLLFRQIQEYRIFEIRPEVKFYRLKKSNRYLAIEVFYLKYNKEKEGGYILEMSNEPVSITYSRTEFVNNKYGFHFKCGSKSTIKSVQFDIFGGLGLSRRISTFQNIEINSQGSIPPETFNRESRELNDVNIHATIGLKIGLVYYKTNSAK